MTRRQPPRVVYRPHGTVWAKAAAPASLYDKDDWHLEGTSSRVTVSYLPRGGGAWLPRDRTPWHLAIDGKDVYHGAPRAEVFEEASPERLARLGVEVGTA